MGYAFVYAAVVVVCGNHCSSFSDSFIRFCVSKVLKYWLCSLDKPLMTNELHEAFIASVDASSHEGKLRR